METSRPEPSGLEPTSSEPLTAEPSQPASSVSAEPSQPASSVPAEPRPLGDPASEHAAPKKRERPSRANTSVRNVAWAVGLNLLIVALVAGVIVGVGRGDRDHVAEAQSQVDIVETAERADDALSFEVVSAVPEGWVVRSAQVETAEPQAWEVRYTSSSGEYVRLLQSTADQRSLAARLDGAVTPGEPVEIAGRECAWLSIEPGSGDDQTAGVGLECALGESNLLISGGSERDEVQALAEEALG